MMEPNYHSFALQKVKRFWLKKTGLEQVIISRGCDHIDQMNFQILSSSRSDQIDTVLPTSRAANSQKGFTNKHIWKHYLRFLRDQIPLLEDTCLQDECRQCTKRENWFMEFIIKPKIAYFQFSVSSTKIYGLTNVPGVNNRSFLGI